MELQAIACHGSSKAILIGLHFKCLMGKAGKKNKASG